jgi:hypothetical protein
MIGFNRRSTDLGVLRTSYVDRATSFTDVSATANSTLAAQTWIKLGMRFDPNFSDNTRAVRFFVNNLECSAALSKATLLATTYLDAKGLGPIFSVASGGSTTSYAYIDWWRCVQTKPGS